MIKTKSSIIKPEINLSGPDGNAFVLLGLAKKLCSQLGKDPEPILAEMKSGDYERLIMVFDKHFGAYVDLVR